MSDLMAHSAGRQPEISVTNAVALSPAIPGSVTPLREACGATLTGRQGQRYCNATCRQRAHRGQSDFRTQPNTRSSSDRLLTRDETVSRPCYALKAHEGLRDGLDTLTRIVDDERARLQAIPLYARQQIARRFMAGLGLKFAETDQ